jgi:hypothetical protein
MDFSQALLEAKNGKAIRRSGWNAADQFVYHVPAASYPAQTGVAKKYFGDDAEVPYTGYLAIKTVQNTVAPWLASQTDLLAEDWEVTEVQSK